MSAEYKVGDRVRIVKRTRSCSEYKFHFTDEMARLEGQIYEISGVKDSSTAGYPVPDDGYCYKLKDSGGYNWASSMFELAQEAPSPSKLKPLLDGTFYYEVSSEEPEVLDFTPKKKHYKLNFSV